MNYSPPLLLMSQQDLDNCHSSEALELSRQLEKKQQQQLCSLLDLKEVVLQQQQDDQQDDQQEDQREVVSGDGPWLEYFSDKHQIPYYYNSETGESMWEKPSNSLVQDQTGQTSRNVNNSLIQDVDNTLYNVHNDNHNNNKSLLSPENSLTQAHNNDEGSDEEFMNEDEEEYLYQRLLMRQQKQQQQQQESSQSSNKSPVTSPSSSSVSSSQERSLSTTTTLSQQRERVDLMHFRAEEAALRKEALRQQFQQQEDRELTGRPHFDTQSYKSHRNWDNMTLSERASIQQANKIAKTEAIREELKKAEQQSIKSKPSISKKSKLMAPRRGIDDMLAWEQERRER